MLVKSVQQAKRCFKKSTFPQTPLVLQELISVPVALHAMIAQVARTAAAHSILLTPALEALPPADGAAAGDKPKGAMATAASFERQNSMTLQLIMTNLAAPCHTEARASPRPIMTSPGAPCDTDARASPQTITPNPGMPCDTEARAYQSTELVAHGDAVAYRLAGLATGA